MNDKAIRNTTNDGLYDLLGPIRFAVLQDEALLRNTTPDRLVEFLIDDWLGFDNRLQEEMDRSPEAVTDENGGGGI